MVASRNVVHAALYLLVALLSVAVTFLLLGAEFVGWVQILIYVGAIMILFLFGLMLTKAPIGRDALDGKNRAVGFVVAVLLFVGLVFLIQDAFPTSDAVVAAGRRAGRSRSARRCSATTCCRSRPCRSCCSRR